MSVFRFGRWSRSRNRLNRKGLKTHRLLPVSPRRSSRLEQLERRQLLAAELDHFLTSRHVDINVQHHLGQWELGLEAEESGNEVQYSTDQALLYAGTPTATTLPSDAPLEFIGVAPGETFYLLPQSQAQNAEAVFLGVSGYGLDDSIDQYDASTESKGRIGAEPSPWAKASLSNVRHFNPDGTPGTGEFSMWQSGIFGQTVVFMSSFDDGVSNPNAFGLDTTDGISADDAVWISAGSHSHYNFGFSQPGRYEIDLRLSAYLGDDNMVTANESGFSQSDPITVYFSVASVGQIQFDASSYSVDESTNTASIDVIRTGGSDGRISVDYATSDGSAVAELDYTAVSGQIVFADGQTRKTIEIPILDDATAEGDESFGVGLLTPTPVGIDHYLKESEDDVNGLLGDVASATVTIRANDGSFGVEGIDDSYLPGDTLNARVTGVTLEEGQEIQWRIRPVGSDFTGTVLSRFIPETDNADARAGQLDMQLDASYDGYEIVAAVMQDGQAIATTEWSGPISVANAVAPLSLTYSGPTPFRIGETASLVATGRELADGESLKVVINASLDHYNLWRSARGYDALDARTFAFEPPSNTIYPLALQVIRDGLVVAQSEAFEVDAQRVEFFFEGMQPVYRAGQTFSATITVDPDLGDKVTYSWAMYDDDQNPMKVAQGEEGRTFEMPLTADLDGERMYIQARVAYESGNTALVGGAYPYLTVIDNASEQLFLFSSLPDHFHQGAPVDLQLFADPGVGEGDSIVWEWRWPGMQWETLPSAEGLTHQMIAEQSMDGVEIRATLQFASPEFDPMVAGPVMIEIDDHGSAPVQQLTIAGDLSVIANNSVTLTGQLPPNVSTVLTTYLWEHKGAGESTFSPIAGQSGSTLSFPATLDDDGAEYRVSILKPDGTVAYGPSPAVSLNVISGSGVVPFALPKVVISEPGYAYNTIGADFNGDGLQDALVNGFADVTYLTEVVWAPNLGDGTFGERQTILPGTSDFIANVFPIDADQDGDLDVVVVGGDALQYHANDGNGNFGAPVSIAGAASHRDAFGGDLDGDGDVDFASITTDGIVQWFRNEGGTYVARDITTGLNGGNAMTAFDADTDGDIDLVVGSNDVKQITLLVNDGTGSFSSSVLADSDIDVRNLYPGDLDGDGLIDIVSASYFDGELAYFRNQGNNTFEKRVVDVNESGVFGGDVGDIDGDGDMDIIAAGFDDTSVSWYANDGAGSFGGRQIIAIDGSAKFSLYDAGLADFNADGQMDVITGDTVNPFAIVIHENQFGSFTNQVIAPVDGIYLEDAAVDLRVHFGVPVDVTGTPGVELQIGGQAVTAEYLSGTGTPTLTFRYVPQGDDVDLDGIALASTRVALPTGAAMTDPLGDDVDLSLPAVDLSGVVINGSAPRVANIARLDPAETAANSVRFAISFSEPVTGVTTDTFAASATDGLTGAAVTGVSGDGADYVVSVDTGSGSGALGLTNGNEGIADLEGNPLALPILGGEVYTLQRRPARTISNYFEGGHADVTINYGNNHWSIQAPDYDLEVSEVLIVGGPDSQIVAPSGDEFDFLGAAPGSDIYVLPESGAPATVPDLGISNIPRPRDAFATFANTDPRVDSTEAWLQLQMVGMRGPEGGEFSLYNSGVTEPTVWMATSDGIDESDSLFAPAGAHGHYNWAFTQPGNYEIDVFASGLLDTNGNGTFDEGIDAYTESGITTLYFQVNKSGEPMPYTIAAEVQTVDVQLVPVALPSDAGVTDLPTGIDAVSVGDRYYVEVWVQDVSGQLGGIAGGHVDIEYTTDLLDALQLTNENFDVLQSGSIDDAVGLINDFGGGTLIQQQALSPQWARLGYVEVLATSAGDAEYRLLPGALPFASFADGNIDFADVDLSDIATVTHTESLQLDFAVLREPTETMGDGSVDQIPDSVSHLHEWEPFYVEVYLSNVSDLAGVETIAFDLSYDTSITTAIKFKPGPSFEFPNGLPLFDDMGGTVSNIQLIATDLGLGTTPVLLGHFLFSPTGSDGVSVNEAGDQILGPWELHLTGTAAAEVAGQEVDITTATAPETAMWGVPYDVDDSGVIDFADFAAFASAFGHTVGDAEPPFTRWADFDGSGFVDYADLAYFDANLGLSIGDFELLTFSMAYPTSELASSLPPIVPELSQAALKSFSSFGPFNNGKNASDVDNSGATSPLDALLVINALASRSNARPFFLDVNNDGQISPLDALWVINRLSRTQSEQASATDEALSTFDASMSSPFSEEVEDEDLLELIAAEQQLF
ncbi:choice-of-anchor M domain-containing protein [Roseiconus lacunae]|uniref:choice-of-anchor M domain-containing protein n=1 Tax=Roseiconus lacunae TaxID=2605694 RepID=UPI001E48A296|nr:choice-of-anchor M domain-containing protein [Roseiconus lacunae]